MNAKEAERVSATYARRRERDLDARYSPVDAANAHLYEQREREVLRALAAHGLLPLEGRRVLDVGCGQGALLGDFARYGARPRDLAGVDLLRWRLPGPGETGVYAVADAAGLPFADVSFDLVSAFTLLSSILAAGSRRQAAAEMLRVLRPGGLVLLYDFWTNPTNRGVRPVRLAALRRLFQPHRVEARRLTLAPPLLRLLAPRSPLACRLLERVPFLQTHYLSTVVKGD